MRKFLAEETRFEGRYARAMLDTLRQAYRPFLLRTLVLLGFGLLGRAVLLGNANLMGYWADSYCKGPSCKDLPAWFQGFGADDYLLVMGALTGIGFLLSLVYRVGLSRYSIEAVSRIYDETTLRTSRLPMVFFDRNPAGRVITRFSSDYYNIFRVFGGPLAEFLTLIFDLLAMTVLIGLASLWYLPFWILLGVLNYGVYRWYLPELRRERREMALKRSPGIAHFSESATGADTIRAFGRQGSFARRFSILNDSYLDQRLSAAGVMVRFSLAMSVVTALVLLATGWASIHLAGEGRVGVGAIGVAFAYIGLSSHVMHSFYEWLGQFEEALTGLERMNEYLRLPTEPGALLPDRAEFETGHARESGSAVPQASARNWDGATEGAAIQIRDLWMRYREDLPTVLQGVDLDVAPGERVAIVGRTGSGKTSLVQALFRLYPVERGSIRVGGHQADGPAPGLSRYRSQMAYITQDPSLFLGSIRENLDPNGDRNDLELIEALKRVRFLPPGARTPEYAYWLNYQVEERGRNLSAGEKQLICMARCLLQNAPVVILDEATSAVDPRSEEVLTQATEELFKGRTQLIIAHRLSTIRSCDRVLWLQGGKVHRIGPPDEVLKEFEGAELHL